MAAPPVIEIREPGQPVRRVTLDRAIEIGRECDGELVRDPGVSRRHLKLVPSPTSLSVVDLGSANGTSKNGHPVTSRTTLEQGDIVRLGDTEIVVLARPVVAKPVAGSRGTVMIRTLGPVAIPKPPPPKPVEVAPSSGRKLWDRVLGIGTDPDKPVFPNFMELPRHIPVPVWQVIRWLSIATYVALVVGLFVRPAGGEFAFFKVIVPLLPILFFVAPGLWRNICPLAASNQTPRVLGFTRGWTVPAWWSRYAYVIAIVLFFGITGARLALFNTSPKATGVLLGVTIVTAFTMGFMFKGKSGWCSSVCPLLPLQRVYGQTPFVTVPNSHCNPCVACTKNCYDFNPRVAYQADLHDPDPGWSAPRKVFVGALPGYVLGFFLLIGNTDLSKPQIIERLALFFLGSIGSFFVLDAVLPLSTPMLAALYGAVAISLFYWYGSPVVQESLKTITGTDITCIRWPIRIVVFALALLWLVRTRVVEKKYEVEAGIAVARAHQAERQGRQGAAGGVRGPGRRPGHGALRARRQGGGRRGRPEPARGLRAQRPAHRGRLPHGGVRRRPHRRARRHGPPQRARGGGAQHPAPARVRREHPHGLLRPPAVGPGDDGAHPRARGRRRGEADRVRPLHRQRGGDRQRHRRRHRGRLRPARPPGLRDPPRRRRVPRPLQPHGHLPPRLRALGHAGAVPAGRGVVRRARHHGLAQHGGHPHRPAVQAGVPRHGRHAVLRPPRAGHGELEHGAARSRGSRSRGPS